MEMLSLSLQGRDSNMIKPADPRQLAVDLLPRSTCSVQVSAVIADRHGIFSWGWNGVGTGYGEHAEAAAIRRANKRRLRGSIIYVVARRQKSGNSIYTRPCDDCMALLRAYRVRMVIYREKDNYWTVEGLGR